MTERRCPVPATGDPDNITAVECFSSLPDGAGLLAGTHAVLPVDAGKTAGSIFSLTDQEVDAAAKLWAEKRSLNWDRIKDAWRVEIRDQIRFVFDTVASIRKAD